MHCSSAGEFEQGKPVAEALKKAYPNHRLLITFFSPSGYGVAKTYGTADAVCYLPLDTRKNADRFVRLVKPELVIFVKYEFWHHHLKAVASRQIPLLLVSAVFRKDQIFFKSYGRFFMRMLRLFTQIFVQDEASLRLLREAGINRCSPGGDSRFDRVVAIEQTASPVPFITEFIGDKQAVVAGSTWQDDERLLKELMNEHSNLKLIIAPHEINDGHLDQLRSLFPNGAFYSAWQKAKSTTSTNVLIVDSVGLLSRLYQHATIAYVGGGFTRDGIHNILEAAVWAKPVLFGPNYKKYREAAEMIAAGGAFSVSGAPALKKLAGDLLLNAHHRQAVGEKARRYVEENGGATGKVLAYIQENRLLTN